MDQAAPAMFQTLEASALGVAIRDAVWVYPAANVGHVLAVVVFAGAVAVMDTRLLGAFAATPAADVLRGARRVAVGAFLSILVTGFLLFTAEASHLVGNRVFLIKMALVALALLNVLAFQFAFGRRLEGVPPFVPLPASVRASAALSLALWFTIAGFGRSIAYF